MVFQAGLASDKAGNDNDANKYFRHGAEKGVFLDIDFFPLKNILWEAKWDKIDMRYWKNLLFRMLCLMRLGRIVETEKINSKIVKYLTHLENTNRESLEEYRMLKSLYVHNIDEVRTCNSSLEERI